MSEDFDIFATPAQDNLGEELAKGSYRWVNKYTRVLGALVLFVGGGASGVWYSQHQSSTSTSVSGGGATLRNLANGSGVAAAAAFGGGSSRRNRGAGGVAGAAGGFGGGGFGGGATAGTITKIDGTTFYLRGADGQAIVVKASAATPVTNTTSEKIAALKVGDAVTVIGSTGNDGTVTPTTVSKGALPVAALVGARGGGAGGGGFGAAAGAGAGAGTGARAGGTGTGQRVRGGAKAGGAGGTAASGASSAGGAGAGAGSAARPAVGGAGGAGNGGAGGGGGGGRFNNPEFTACLAKAGVTFDPGSRPDMADPKVAAAMTKCRDLLPQAGAGGPAGGGAGGPAGGGGNRNGGQGSTPTTAPTN